MALYQFTWNRFCDWYLELSKQDLYNGTPERKKTAQYVLWYTLENLLRLLHPFMPFITEEIWQALPGTKTTPTIMQAEYPSALDNQPFGQAAHNINFVMDVISGIRNIRGEMEVPPSQEISVILSCGSEESVRLMKHNEGAIISLSRLSSLAIGQGVEQPEDSSLQVVEDVRIFVPLKGMVNVEEEEKRLLKEIGKTEEDRIAPELLSNSWRKNWRIRASWSAPRRTW